MKEKIEQLCGQIKDLLKKNDREYIIAITPEETYSNPGFTFPEYFKNIIDNSEYGFNELLCDDSIDVDWDDFIIDEYVESSHNSSLKPYSELSIMFLKYSGKVKSGYEYVSSGVIATIYSLSFFLSKSLI